MNKKMFTISTAESCTGGRIAAAITARSGASRYFQGSLVAYQDTLKEQMLGVSRNMIETHGVVSSQVAEQMVKGACRLSIPTMPLLPPDMLRHGRGTKWKSG